MINIGTTYDPDWFNTHAAIVGMTGSGKTGLGIVTLEELAVLGVPAIIIDPKGDLTNLTFHDESELDNVEYSIFTPGLDTGFPVNILASLKHSEINRERIASIATAILGLASINSNPLEREHILLANIIETTWLSGKSVDLPYLINAIQAPPFDRLGVMPLENFYPEKARYKLAVKLNNFLAAPSFKSWLEGQPLEIESFLYKGEKPQFSIFYLSHLSEPERMFFVTLLFTSIEGWMRTRAGSDKLQAVIYFDEVAGYIPPVKKTPTKPVVLRLLKQARAYGLGLILATQNPGDLDYKALSNIGTWMIGKLQTDQDKAKLKEGLENQVKIPQLEHRKFLLHSIYQEPIVFTVRESINKLVGPITPDEIEGDWVKPDEIPVKIIPAIPSKYDVFYHKGKGTYEGYLGGRAKVTFVSRKYDIFVEKTIGAIWDGCWKPFDLIESNQQDFEYKSLDLPDITKNDFEEWIYRSQVIEFSVNKTLQITGNKYVFTEIAMEKQDAECSIAYKKYREKLDNLKIRLESEQQKLRLLEEKLKSSKAEEIAASFEFGLSLASKRQKSISTSMRKSRMVKEAAARVETQNIKINGLKNQWQMLNDGLNEEYEKIKNKWMHIAEDIAEERIRPFKKDILVEIFGVIWIPTVRE